MYKKVELKDGFVGIEREVAENWKKKDIIKKNATSDDLRLVLICPGDHTGAPVYLRTISIIKN